MNSYGHDIIVIGASAGGSKTLPALLERFPADFPAAVFVVQHATEAIVTSSLAERLDSASKLNCQVAAEGMPIQQGCIYIAPADHHLLVQEGHIKVTRGAHENRFRPSVDALFRSAAVAYGSRVVGVILTGMLDDGSVGLNIIKRCGGIAVVQSPEDAPFAEMPLSALQQTEVDHIVTINQMSDLLERLAFQAVRPAVAVPDDVLIEAEIAERLITDGALMQPLENPSVFSCPDCGGVLWEVNTDHIQRYRCRTGHTYTAATLLQGQQQKMNETLWVALRMLEERRNLLASLVEKDRVLGRERSVMIYEEKLKEAELHISRLRQVLLNGHN